MKTVQVIESIEGNRVEWLISLTDTNPEKEHCFIVFDAKEAFRVKGMLEVWANNGIKNS